MGNTAPTPEQKLHFIERDDGSSVGDKQSYIMEARPQSRPLNRPIVDGNLAEELVKNDYGQARGTPYHDDYEYGEEEGDDGTQSYRSGDDTDTRNEEEDETQVTELAQEQLNRHNKSHKYDMSVASYSENLSLEFPQDRHLYTNRLAQMKKTPKQSNTRRMTSQQVELQVDTKYYDNEDHYPSEDEDDEDPEYVGETKLENPVEWEIKNRELVKKRLRMRKSRPGKAVNSRTAALLVDDGPNSAPVKVKVTPKTRNTNSSDPRRRATPSSRRNKSRAFRHSSSQSPCVLAVEENMEGLTTHDPCGIEDGVQDFISRKALPEPKLRNVAQMKQHYRERQIKKAQEEAHQAKVNEYLRSKEESTVGGVTQTSSVNGEGLYLDITSKKMRKSISNAIQETLHGGKCNPRGSCYPRRGYYYANDDPSYQSQGMDLEPSPSDDEYDLEFFAKYEKFFTNFMKQHRELQDSNPDLIEHLRVVKLQKMLETAVEAEARLEKELKALEATGNKTDHYKKELAEAIKENEAKDKNLHEELFNLEQASRVEEGKITWETILSCDSLAKTQQIILGDLFEQEPDNLLDFLPDVMEMQEIHDAVAAGPKSKDMQEIRQLQVDNACLNAEAQVLEKKLAALQAKAKKHAWVDSTFLRMDENQMMDLKQGFKNRLGVDFEAN